MRHEGARALVEGLEPEVGKEVRKEEEVAPAAPRAMCEESNHPYKRGPERSNKGGERFQETIRELPRSR
jgi:hypothetical protein